jgi:hypothetical protein
VAKRAAAAADEQARLVSMAMGQPRVGQFPGPWPTQGTIGSPSTYSPANSPMFHETYVPGMSRFTPSPPEYDPAMHEGIATRGTGRHRRRVCCSLVFISIAGLWLIRSPKYWAMLLCSGKTLF